jgi:hypothetical protein
VDDVALIDASLLALGGREAAFREQAFGRFLLGAPGRTVHFLNLPASGVRMADMALGWMRAQAAGEAWLEGEVAEIVHTHLGFGRPGPGDYAAFLDDCIAALDRVVGLDAATRGAWEAAAAGLKPRVAAMLAAWAAVVG